MATIEKYILNLDYFQEGNLGSIDLEMDSSFPMTNVAVTMEVRDSANRIIMQKSSSGGTISIDGQNITIPILPDDTKRRAGRYNYEIDFINESSQPFATIGGALIVNAETNKLVAV
jgi:hypothetical protein